MIDRSRASSMERRNDVPRRSASTGVPCCGGDEGIGIGFPSEGLGVGIVLGEVAVDRGLEVDDSDEGASSEPSFGERGEEALDGVEPGGASRVKWKVTRGCRVSQAITF